MSVAAMLERFDSNVAALVAHGHAQALAYPYRLFAAACALHAKKD